MCQLFRTYYPVTPPADSKSNFEMSEFEYFWSLFLPFWMVGPYHTDSAISDCSEIFIINSRTCFIFAIFSVRFETILGLMNNDTDWKSKNRNISSLYIIRIQFGKMKSKSHHHFSELNSNDLQQGYGDFSIALSYQIASRIWYLDYSNDVEWPKLTVQV